MLIGTFQDGVICLQFKTCLVIPYTQLKIIILQIAWGISYHWQYQQSDEIMY